MFYERGSYKREEQFRNENSKVGNFRTTDGRLSSSVYILIISLFKIKTCLKKIYEILTRTNIIHAWEYESAQSNQVDTSCL
jgi:hypothetical protein